MAEIESVLRISQATSADIFGFGQALYRTDPSVWRRVAGRWQELLPEYPVKVTVSAHIPRTGLITIGHRWNRVPPRLRSVHTFDMTAP